MKHRIKSIFIVCLWLCLCCSLQERRAAAAEAIFSRLAISVGDGPWGREVSVPSPDQSKTARCTPSMTKSSLLIRTAGRDYQVPLVDPIVQPNILWAPDSSSFLFTFSSGGVNGLYTTELVSLKEERIVVDMPFQAVVKNYGGYRQKLGISCNERPNVFAIRWTSSTKALIATQTMDHSVCDCYGTFRMYEVDVPAGTIIRTYDQPLAKDLFRNVLGVFLLHANDKWILDPGSCRLSSNHGD